MGNNLKKKFNQEKDIQLKILLDKVCYYPWEKVSGNLVIKPKKFIKDEIFKLLFYKNLKNIKNKRISLLYKLKGY